MPQYIIRDAAGKQLKDASINAADVSAALDAARLFCSPLVLRGAQGSFGIYEGAVLKALFTVNGMGTPPAPVAVVPKVIPKPATTMEDPEPENPKPAAAPKATAGKPDKTR